MNDDELGFGESLAMPRSLEDAQRLVRRVKSDGSLEDQWSVLELIRAASVLEERDPAAIESFLVSIVLPECLQGEGANVEASQARRMMFEWLTALPDEIAERVRRGVLQVARRAAAGGSNVNAVYTLAAIGHRNRGVMKTLLKVSNRDDHVGHEALRMLIGLRPSRQMLVRITRRVRETPREAWSEELLNAAAQLEDIRLLPMLTAAARQPGAWFTLHRISWVGQRAPNDQRRQRAVWDAIREVVDGRDDGWRELLVSGGVVERVNSPEIVGWLLEHLHTAVSDSVVQFLRWAARLAEVRSVYQLAGWRRVAHDDILDVLRPFLLQDSEVSGIATTEKADAKEAAIDVMLASGHKDSLNLLSVVLQNESSAMLGASLLDQLAVLSVPELPRQVGEALDAAGGFERGPTDRDRLVLFLASCRLATSSSHLSSLTRVLQSKGNTGGHPFTVPVNAAAEQAVWLYRTAPTAIDRLLLAPQTLGNVMGRSVSARAYVSIALCEEGLSAVVRNTFIEWAVNPSVETYVRRDAIRALANDNKLNRTAVSVDALLTASRDRERDVRNTALAGLLSLGLVAETRAAMRLRESDSEESAQVAELLGRLAAMGDGRDVTEALEVLAKADVQAAERLYKGVATQVREGGVPNAVLVDGLLAHTRTWESETRANTTVFSRLAVIAPERLIEEQWQVIWNRWMANSRQALADAVPDAVARRPDLKQEAGRLLTRLLGDGMYSVRRASARSLAHVDSAVLARWCTDALGGGTSALRRAAAEAGSWLSSESRPRGASDRLLSLAAHDEERSVRDSAERARRERQLRYDAESLRQRVAKPHDDGNDWVLSGYAAGLALTVVGDDSDIDYLAAFRLLQSVPPNVRHWLWRIEEELGKTWRKRVEEWPEPSSQWRGALETVDAEIRIAEERIQARLSLWRREIPGPEQHYEWGGGIWTLGSRGYRLAFGRDDKEIEIAVHGRRPAHATVHAVSDKRVLLRGTGSYPA